jgi:[protein-PII] uridylyltransferase
LALLADSWFEGLAAALSDGWALAATGGYGGGVLCPGSDIDVVLLHPPKMSETRVGEVANALWYPLWDAGVKLSPSVHSRGSLLQLAGTDLAAATSTLRMRCIAGDSAVVRDAQQAAQEQWRKKSTRWLVELREDGEQRWMRFGDVASLLEPDLKDGRGGLRDFDMIRWALLTDRDEVVGALEGPIDDLAGAADLLLSVRCELHRATGRTSNVLLLQDQDHVGAALGITDADALMLQVSSAAHSIEWAGARFWRRIELMERAKRKAAPKSLASPIVGVAVVDHEVHVSAEAEYDDPALVFRIAAAAAHAGVPLSAKALRTLAARAAQPGERWTDRTRRHFLSLLGSGEAVVSAVETLEQYELFSRYLPEWRPVRSLPQRNAFHRYTVDRHLLRTVANANELVRDVARLDLLLVAALLHDIGKGHPGDHTEVGVELVAVIAERMGFPPDDEAVLVALVEHHLLLPETATRRDLSDPRTAANVAEAVGSPLTLELLHALVEADSKATGPSAWSAWKASLIDQLVHAVGDVLGGHPPAVVHDAEHRFGTLIGAVRSDGALHVEHEPFGDVDALRIASRDRQGLFAIMAGVLAVHGLDVVGADAHTSPDGIAVDQFLIVRLRGGSPNWGRVEADLRAAIAGDLDLEARLDQRIRTYARSQRSVAAAPARLDVIVSNDASDVATMIDVRAPDGLAVLYRLSRALSAAGLDIRSAKVATLGHEVVDVFYVQRNGGKPAEAEHDAIRALLLAALAN